MFARTVGTTHQATEMCKKATSRRKKQKVVTQHAEMKANVEFTLNGKPIQIVEKFEYLGRIVTKDDEDEPAVMINLLARARTKWASMRRFQSQTRQIQRQWQRSTEQWFSTCYFMAANLGY
jgi:hypothetical protein